MHELSIFWEPPCNVEAVREQLGDTFALRFVIVREIQKHQPDQYTIIDANLKDTSRLLEIKDWLGRKPKHGKVVCVVDRKSHIEETRAFAIGATDVVSRPLARRDLVSRLWGDIAQPAKPPPEFQKAPGVMAAFNALQSVFSAATLGGDLDEAALNTAGEGIVSQIGNQGLGSWIETVRKHHSQTYQHCLLVTGLAVAFGEHLGVSQRDRMRLSFAGLLHDIGKARIPLSILEKPARLDPDEFAVIKTHPQLGVEALKSVSGLQPEMLDIVLHHHEYLDGSGYPDGLRSGAISDPVRIMTIADVFGALIERRSYKPPLSGEAAYQILLDMGPKLDQDLVREFKPVARLGRQS